VGDEVSTAGAASVAAAESAGASCALAKTGTNMIPASMNKAINFLIMCFLNRLLIKVKWFPD
jgi:hypothetical protein